MKTHTNYSTLSLELARFQFWLILMVAAIEAFAWYGFGSSPFTAIGFGLFGVLVALLRPKLAKIEMLAIKHRQIRLANTANLLVILSVIITSVSLFIVYTDEMDKFQQQRLSETAAVRLAQSKLAKLQNELETVQKSSTWTPEQLESAYITSQSLKQQLLAAQKAAANRFEQASRAAESKLSEFWTTKHQNGLSYAQIINLDGTPRSYKGGTLKSAARSIEPQLIAIKQLFPQPPENDSDVQSIKNQIRQLDEQLALKQKLDYLKSELSDAELNLIQQQQQINSQTTENTLPAAFHQMSKFLYG